MGYKEIGKVRVRRMMRLDFSLAIQKKFEKVLREG
jgi:hypothetical protein